MQRWPRQFHAIAMRRIEQTAGVLFQNADGAQRTPEPALLPEAAPQTRTQSLLAIRGNPSLA
ncbi:hypothetical protein, partial [Pseudomonas viridiflava]|uniref:hypothetical protein n=1 Tax=Pseudomonas viridiflava TaxID=33069 RepID=UPI0013E05FD9